MEGVGETECWSRDGPNAGGDRLREVLAGGANGGDHIDILTADKECAALGQPVQVDDAAIVLLDDLQAVATARTAAKLGGRRERGMSEHKDGGGRWFGVACAVEETAGVIGDGGLLYAEKRGECLEVGVHGEPAGGEFGQAAKAWVGSSLGVAEVLSSGAVRRRN